MELRLTPLVVKDFTHLDLLPPTHVLIHWLNGVHDGLPDI